MGAQYTAGARGLRASRRGAAPHPHPIMASTTNIPQSGRDADPVSAPAGRLGLALGIAVLLAVALFWLRPASQPPAGGAAASNAPVEPAEPAAPPVPAEVWREAFPLERAEVHMTPAERKATASTPGMAAVAALNRALQPYRAGDDQKAAVELEGVLLDHPDEYRAALYLGVSRLYIDEPQAAIEVLRQAQQSRDPDVLADADWYILVGIARLRVPDQAESDARSLCARGGPPSVRACRAVEVLANARAAAR